LLQPKVEMTMAAAISTAPVEPNTACMAAVATRFCGAPWISAKGSTITYARFASR
jgi:hypothetical protein